MTSLSRHFLKTAVATASLLLAACGGDESGVMEETVPATPDYAALEGSSWELTELVALGGFVFEPDDPAKYTLNFRSDNRLTGKSDCNTYTANWNAETDFTITDFSSSRSLCIAGSLHNFYQLYMRDVSSLEQQNDVLVLGTTDDDVRLTFQRQVD